MSADDFLIGYAIVIGVLIVAVTILQGGPK